MNLEVFAEQIFDALEGFDRSSAPFGLYAAGDLAGEEPQRGRKGYSSEKMEAWKMRREHPEAEGALLPLLETLDAVKEEESHFPGWNAFSLPELGRINFQFKRVSKIKVRQYGSKYHVDNQENFGERWDKLQMDKAIAGLWVPTARDIQLRALLFVGFDKAVRPFERELNELKPHQTRASHGIEFFERSWDDSMGRGFKIKAALWVRGQSQDGAITHLEAD